MSNEATERPHREEFFMSDEEHEELMRIKKVKRWNKSQVLREAVKLFARTEGLTVTD